MDREMKMKASRLIIPLFLLSTFIFSNVSAQLYPTPVIQVYPPPSKTFPLKVYWSQAVPGGCTVQSKEMLYRTLHVAQLMLKHSIYRFLDENPDKYDELAQL